MRNLTSSNFDFHVTPSMHECVKKVQRARKKSSDSLSLPNKNTILINIKLYYFTRYGKNAMKFNQQKTKYTLIIEK